MRTTTLGLAVVAAVGPVLYPAGLLLAARRHPVPRPPSEPWTGRLSVVVAAYREAAVIAAKIADLRADGWPGLEIVVVADDAETAAAARAQQVVVVEPGRRVGKSAALGLGVAASAGEVIVFSDANTLLEPGSLAALTRWFADPSVGGVAGEKTLAGGGEGAYWAFESMLKRAESRLGGTIGLVGEISAVRRSAWRNVPADVAVDDLWIALDLAEQGLRVPYEVQARASEPPSNGLREEYERRARIVAGMYDVLARRRHQLLRPDRTAAQLWGHRLVRVGAGPLAHVALLAVAATTGRRTALGRLFLLGNAGAAAAVAAQARGLVLPGPVRAAGTVAFLQAVGLAGTARYARGDRPALWVKVDRNS